MLGMENIKREKDCISCTAFVEDCKQGIQLSVTKNGSLKEEITLPEGYEWCKNYISRAIRFLMSLWDEESVPERKTIMWY